MAANPVERTFTTDPDFATASTLVQGTLGIVQYLSNRSRLSAVPLSVINTPAERSFENLCQIMLFLWPSPSWAPLSTEHTSKFLLCSVRPSSISVPLPACLSFPLSHSTSAAVVSSLFLECAPAVGPWICCYVFLEHSFPHICTACSLASFKFSLKCHLLNETFPDYLIEYFLAIPQILFPHTHFSSSCPALFSPQPNITV